jgi:hypothetical protein
MAGQRFYARRLLPPRNGAPLSATDLGAVQTAGWLTVVAADEHSALARVDYACDAIRAGDYLEPFIEVELPARRSLTRATSRISAIWAACCRV